MKLYFAKYLPVEGEIKEGDFFLWKDEVHRFHSDAGYGMKTYTQYNEKNGSSLVLNWSNYRGVVKLFLCSRDIQVGDDIWFEGLAGNLKQGHFYGITKGNNGEDIVDLTANREGTGFDLHSKIGFKVIGEISPDALSYVKEGDEFDRNDILVREWGGSSVRKPIEYANITECSKILIKGPCGHFH